MDDVLEALSLAISDLLDGEWLFPALIGVIVLTALALLGMRLLQARGQVQRRIDHGEAGKPGQNPAIVTTRVGAIATSLAENLGEMDAEQGKLLRTRLVQAGFIDRNAVAMFFGLRVVCLGICAVLLFGLVSFLMPDAPLTTFGIAGMVGAIFGYIAPSMALTKRIERLKLEHRAGFPDFMDLMVVCSQAGLSMEAGLTRISQEIAVAFPSLARNLDFATREIRSGKPLSKAIESFAQRLGIDEAVSFATLLQQSEELGSSITQSLRAYSDDMRNKRLMKAEEKAYALPAKLVVPLTVFIFPVLLVVLMLPVVISVTGMRM